MTCRPRLFAALMLAAAVAACSGTQDLVCTAPGADVVYVVDHGWHTDIGIPAGELSGGAAVFRSVFPGAASVVFSYGKRTFMTAPADDWSEYVLGPIPGPAAILVTGLNVMPDAAYGGVPSVLLHLPQGGASALSDFIWHEIAKDPAGRPRLIDAGPFEGGLFYAATRTYTLADTCNTWAADVLRAAGAPVSPDGVVFAYQVMARARQAAQCELPGPARAAEGSG